MTGVNGRFHFRPRRIHHAGKTQKDEDLLNLFGPVRSLARWQGTESQRQYAQDAAGIFVVDGHNFGARGFIQWLYFPTH